MIIALSAPLRPNAQTEQSEGKNEERDTDDNILDAFLQHICGATRRIALFV